jgi:rhodanese-related sulfurtransferase
MEELKLAAKEIRSLVREWEVRLAAIDTAILINRRNSQNRTIKQILGHMVDSASNNLHRIVHLQYRDSPLDFPDYANLGVNDIWIGLQNYQDEEWSLLLHIWKFSNLHLAHVIDNISADKINSIWVSALQEKITLLEMVTDYPRHFRLHLGEISSLAELDDRADTCSPRDLQQVNFYLAKLSYEIDASDLIELRNTRASVVVIDTRSSDSFAIEHIAGAISFPHRSITSESTLELDSSQTYITYCDGIGCNASTKGALKLAQLGFKVKELQGGLDWWKRDGYTTEGLRAQKGGADSCGCS